MSKVADLVSLLERARDTHMPFTRYRGAILHVAGEASPALVKLAIECVREARERDGTRRGRTQRCHWEAAIALARSQIIGAAP